MDRRIPERASVTRSLEPSDRRAKSCLRSNDEPRRPSGAVRHDGDGSASGSEQADCETSPMQKLSASGGRGSRGRRTVSRQQPATRSRAVDTPSAASLITLAPPFGQALPTLEHAPTHYNHEVNGGLLYTLCAELVGRGLGTPDIWRKCGRNAVV